MRGGRYRRRRRSPSGVAPHPRDGGIYLPRLVMEPWQYIHRGKYGEVTRLAAVTGGASLSRASTYLHTSGGDFLGLDIVVEQGGGGEGE